ncbi:MAG: hypothetical protein II013_02880 [Lachnobacterium sp.]|nr:hypothetical protein [Lachnobacterium sp.]
MARSRIGLQIDGLDYYTAKLNEMGKRMDLVVEKALIASKKHVTRSLVKDSIKPNYPHSGKYSYGTVAKSIDKDNTVYWEGSYAFVKVGYDFKKSGLVSIFLMYGVKKRKIDAAEKLYDDIYGARARREIKKIQETVFKQEILKGGVWY